MTEELKNRLNRLDDMASSEPPRRRSGRGFDFYLFLGLIGCLGIGGLVWYVLTTREGDQFRDLEFQAARRGKIIFTIVEKGELEAAKNVDITCRVRASGRGNTVASTIKWVIDDGTRVRKGDLVMLLDDAGIKEQIKNQQGIVVTAVGNKTDAEKSLDIVLIENESNIKMAQNNVAIAELDLAKYIKGDLEKERKEVFGQITLKESELLQSKDRVGWSSRMVRKGYLSESQARVDEFRLRSSEIDLERLNEQRRVLDDYESERMILDLKNKLEQALMAEKVAKTTADSKLVQAETKLNVALTTFNQEQLKLDELNEDLRNCRITAPNDGMVIYYIPEQSRFGGGTQQSTIAVGEPVREGQKLMRLPDLRRMLVRVKIHESYIPRLRADVMRRTGFSDRFQAATVAGLLGGWERAAFGLVWPEVYPALVDLDEEVADDGLPCFIKIASVERPVIGHLKFVSPVASSTDWMSSDVKVYQCLVRIDERVDNLKPGMSAEVTVIGDEREDVLRLPVQAVLEAAGEKFCYVRVADKIVKRTLVTGLNDSRFIEILPESDLKEGEPVLLNARKHAERMDDLKASGSAELNTAKAGFRTNGTRPQPTATTPEGGAAAPATRPTGPRGTRPGGRPGGGMPAWASQLTPQQQQEISSMFPRLGGASPEERKKLIDGLSVSQNIKDDIKKGMRERGLEIAD